GLHPEFMIISAPMFTNGARYGEQVLFLLAHFSLGQMVSALLCPTRDWCSAVRSPGVRGSERLRELTYEKNADQRNSARRVACGPGRRPKTLRPRHRSPLPGAEEIQYLQG